MTLLVASIIVEEAEALSADSDAAFAAGADAVELRLDSFDGDPQAIAEFLRNNSHRQWIVTYRSAEDGGSFLGDTMDRVSRILGTCRGTGATVDFEWSDWKRSDNIRQKIRLACGGTDDGNRLILSAHDFEKPPYDVDGLAAEMVRTDGLACAKIAYRASTVQDTFAAMDLIHRYGSKVISIAMGEDGLWTRVLAKKFDAYATFASAVPGEETAPGQLTIQEMRDFRFDAIGANTRVYGVLGDPVTHSMSPLIFNRWFAEFGIDAVYLPIRVRGGDEGVRGFLGECARRPWLDLGGFSVTHPHKRAVLDCSNLKPDSMSQGIGACNTLSFDRGAASAFNTDAYAGVGSIIEALDCTRADLPGVSVDLLGGGGAARSIAYALHELGCQLTVYARSAERVATLVDEFDCKFAPWETRAQRSGEIVINCTTIGFDTTEAESPLPSDAFRGCRLVLDMIYNPLETALLSQAKQAGVATANGLGMFVRQARTQFELWTGHAPDIEQARRWITETINTRS